MTFFVLIALGLIFATTSVNSLNNINVYDVTNERCTVTDLTINPCTSFSNNLCTVTRGDTIAIKFYYKVQFYSLRPKIKMHILNSQGASIFTFIEEDTNQYTPCPVVGFKYHIFNMSIPVPRNTPVGTKEITMKFWDVNTYTNVCEFNFELNID